MSDVIRWGGKIDGAGRFVPEAPEAYFAFLRARAGKRVNVILTLARDIRTLEQNAHLWGWVYENAVAEGVDLVEIVNGQPGEPIFKTREDVHRFAKANLLTQPVLTNRGLINLLGTTTTLTPAEFSEYTERLCAKLAGYGVFIPPTR